MSRKILGCLILLCLFMQTVLAAAPNQLKQVRFSQRPEVVRIVFDLVDAPQYTVVKESNGTKLVIDFAQTVNKSKLSQLPIKDALVKRVTFSEGKDSAVRATIELERSAAYKVEVLKNPNRLFIDIVKAIDQKTTAELAPGINYTMIRRSTEGGMMTAHVLDVDTAQGYRLQPLLGNDKIEEREVLSSMAKRHKAIAAVNASYFSLNGEILGLTKINGKIASTTYVKRSAFGLLPDGSPVIGQVEYNGAVEFGAGQTLPVSGVNNERGENDVIIYNDFYSTSTKTNTYGNEYIIEDDHVVGIQQANTALTPGKRVLSVHGASKDKLAQLRVGDPVKIKEDLGSPWNEATTVLGVGPMLVKNNSLYLTTKAESFGADVADGRAPRTAVGITENKHVLMVVVDGRQQHSTGFTLLEMALFMQELGAKDAINFDGGGSSEMVVNQRIVNSPSDGRERRIGSALAILPK